MERILPLIDNRVGMMQLVGASPIPARSPDGFRTFVAPLSGGLPSTSQSATLWRALRLWPLAAILDRLGPVRMFPYLSRRLGQGRIPRLLRGNGRCLMIVVIWPAQ